MDISSLLRTEYLKNNKFLFFMKTPDLGVTASFSFANISNLAQNIEYDSITVGGYNQGPVLLPKNKTKADTITLERGVRRNLLTANLDMLHIGDVVEEGLIIVLNGFIPVKAYAFDEGIITRASISPLQAKSAEILIKTLEIAHSGLQEVSV